MGADNEKQLKLRFGEDLWEVLTERAERNGASLNSEIIRRLRDSVAADENEGGAGTETLVLRIRADLKSVEALSGASWVRNLNAWGAAKRLINDAVNQYRPPSEGSDKLAATQAKRDQDYQALGVLLAAQSKAEEAGIAPSAEWTSQVDALLKHVGRTQAEIDASIEEVLAEEDSGQDLYDRINQNRAMASALAGWGKRGASDGA